MKLIQKIFSYLLLVNLFLLSGCMSQKTTDNGLKILDVNEQLYYNDAHIAGAINASYKNLDAESKDWNKDAPIVVYCSNYQCTESTRVAEKLQKLGFANVSVYKGGTQEWYQLNKQNPEAYPIVGPGDQRFLKNSIEKVSESEYTLPIVNAQELSKLIQAKNLKK